MSSDLLTPIVPQEKLHRSFELLLTQLHNEPARDLHSLKSGRQSLWKRDCPRQVADLPVVIADKKTSDSSDRVTDRQSRSGSGKNGE